MKILLDHNIPHGLRGALADHDVHTADYVGWGRLRNGDLLEVAASNGYEIFITCDQGIPYEQNLGRFRITVLTPDEWRLEHHPPAHRLDSDGHRLGSPW